MIADNLRETVRTLFESGKGKKGIARYLHMDVKTVRAILRNETNKPLERNDKIKVDEQLLRELHGSCDGYVERMYETMREDHKIEIGYSTLTRLVREYGLSGPEKTRCYDYPDIPGEEMQQDTSIYHVPIGGKKTKVICSGLYLRYSKMRYVKFYPWFKRFTMKCFFHEALSFFGYCARICIIDNTNLAVLYGSGEKATFHPEMVAFSKHYGFRWKAHRIRLANRKAGKERNFLTLQTNFFPGRSFKSLDDLNEQAFRWSTERFARRPLSKSRLIPCELFNLEKSYLVCLPDYIQPPYEQHQRDIDKGGYISFNANYYWVPETSQTLKKNKNTVKVVEYEKRIDIYLNHEKLITYNLPAWDVKNRDFYPTDVRPVPLQPNNRKKGCDIEEEKLRAMDPVCHQYVDFIKSSYCKIKQKPRLIRDLYRLTKKLEPSLFVECLTRALKYKIDNIDSLAKIAGQLLQQSSQNDVSQAETSLPLDEYEQRSSYKKGEFSSEADPKAYSNFMVRQCSPTMEEKENG
jgi:hypothetical protein